MNERHRTKGRREVRVPSHRPLSRRQFGVAAALGLGLLDGLVPSAEAAASKDLNAATRWPLDTGSPELSLTVDAGTSRHRLERRIFGTNLEWFNDAGGFGVEASAARLAELAKAMGVTVLRFPGGILADYYRWEDGIGVPGERPERRHPTDPGRSSNRFGSPELFRLMQKTGAEALLTVNAGTGTPEQAADWVAYCNRPEDGRRRADGFPAPIGVKLWEIGNELYLPGNPGEQKIGTTPQVYAGRFVAFVKAMRRIDPTITAVGIGVAPGPHVGPSSAYPEWSRVLLESGSDLLDQISVHNAYFPVLYKAGTPPLELVYPALWAAPDAVEEDLAGLGALMGRFEAKRSKPIGIALTEWGALFSVPNVDPYWTDHVKTLGSSVYLARMLQVLLADPRVALANHFKFTDRSFMGCVNYEGLPKTSYFALQLMAKESGTHCVPAVFESMAFYDTEGVGTVAARRNVPDVTAFASRDETTGRLFVNLVNRSLRRVHRVRLKVRGMTLEPGGELVSLSGAEPTASAGRDLPPEWPYSIAYEPYTSGSPMKSLQRKACRTADALVLPPFSIATFVVDSARRAR